MPKSSAAPVTVAKNVGRVSGLAYDPEKKEILYLDNKRSGLFALIPGKEPRLLLTGLNNPRQLTLIPSQRYSINRFTL